ncbi:unnamed protein product [Urochloa humidicola]
MQHLLEASPITSRPRCPKILFLADNLLMVDGDVLGLNLRISQPNVHDLKSDANKPSVACTSPHTLVPPQQPHLYASPSPGFFVNLRLNLTPLFCILSQVRLQLPLNSDGTILKHKSEYCSAQLCFCRSNN